MDTWNIMELPKLCPGFGHQNIMKYYHQIQNNSGIHGSNLITCTKRRRPPLGLPRILQHYLHNRATPPRAAFFFGAEKFA